MSKLIAYLKDIHINLSKSLEIPPFITISLLILYTLISGVFGHIIGMDLFADDYQPFTPGFEIFSLRIAILLLYIILNIAFLYLMILWFKRERMRIPVLLSYYAIVTTAVFFASLILFSAVLGLYHFFGMGGHTVFIVFGASLVAIFTVLNLYPGYLFYLAVKERPIDIFWPFMMYIAGIHLISYLLFRLWGAVDTLSMWVA
ncbi:hypothetical protein WN59_04435 [Salinicoccus sediminis]|uniref:Yip1 domain-containing protein n=1 Tax=Salinicoccus sediminis TaxID=1432562 RepID=A0A0M2SMN0_9STAP|nr:hypothetical protein [Salinicoccus sediminis]KKK34906.1 hypothetical protein WN59_04435 [Salinicoccus sediminis]